MGGQPLARLVEKLSMTCLPWLLRGKQSAKVHSQAMYATMCQNQARQALESMMDRETDGLRARLAQLMIGYDTTVLR